MKKVRLFLVAALASSFMIVGAGPASANCQSDPNVPVDACAAVCEIGQGNKHTQKLFSFCEVW